MRIAAYCRKSIYSDKSDSVDNQQRMCREYVDMKFGSKIDSFTVYSDEGFTGANTKRPGLKRLLDDIKNGMVDVLAVYQLDRLSRDVRDFANIYSFLEERNVMFISIKENIDTATPIGKAMMYVTMVFAQMERESIAMRVTDNLMGLAKKGLWVGGNPPYGYVRKSVMENGKKHVIIEPDPEAAAFVESVFDDFLNNNYSLNNLETAYKRAGVKTPRGAFFSNTQLYKMLTMPFCCPNTPEVYDYYKSLGCVMPDEREKWDGKHGVMVYGRSTEKHHKHELQPKSKWTVCTGAHQAFIPAEKWLEAQRRFSHNAFDKTMKYDVPLLKGALICKCGRRMGVARRRRVDGSILSEYYCPKRSRQGITACDNGFIDCEKLDGKVLQIFSEIAADDKMIEDFISEPEEIKSAEVKLKKLESDASKIRKRIHRLTESIAGGGKAAKYIIPEIEKEDLTLSALEREIDMLKADEAEKRDEETDTRAKAEMIKKMMKNLSGFTASEKNEVVKAVLKECVWDGKVLKVSI